MNAFYLNYESYRAQLTYLLPYRHGIDSSRCDSPNRNKTGWGLSDNLDPSKWDPCLADSIFGRSTSEQRPLLNFVSVEFCIFGKRRAGSARTTTMKKREIIQNGQGTSSRGMTMNNTLLIVLCLAVVEGFTLPINFQTSSNDASSQAEGTSSRHDHEQHNTYCSLPCGG
jgi:hypothetical protein